MRGLGRWRIGAGERSSARRTGKTWPLLREGLGWGCSIRGVKGRRVRASEGTSRSFSKLSTVLGKLADLSRVWLWSVRLFRSSRPHHLTIFQQDIG